MIVALAVDPTRRRRWVADLARRLLGHGHVVRLVDGPARPPERAVTLLLDLERMLLRRHRPLGADPDGLDVLPRLSDADRPDVVLDLTATPAERPGATTLAVRFDGTFGEDALVAPLLAGRIPVAELVDLATGAVLERAVASGELAVGIGGGMDSVTTRLSALVAARLGDPDRPMPPPIVHRTAARSVAAHAARFIASTAVLTLYRLCCNAPHWRVGWRHVEGDGLLERGDVGGTPWRVLPDPGSVFYADPFPITYRGRTAVFMEGLDHAVGKGFIAAVPFGSKGPSGPVRTVLEEAWHLSFPFLWQEGDDLYMLPESSLAGRLVLYRCVDFPDRWERVETLLEGVEIGDATLVRHGGRLYMLGAGRDGTGGYSDTLVIYMADSLFGPWVPHPGNPILVDIAAARPAGGMVVRQGRLFRPIQDCTAGYGAALALAEVTRLDPTGFAQTVYRTVRPGPAWPGRKLHTLNRHGSLEVVDGTVVRPKPGFLIGLADRLQAPRPDAAPMAATADPTPSRGAPHPATDDTLA